MTLMSKMLKRLLSAKMPSFSLKILSLYRKVVVPEYAENDYLQFELLQGGRTVATLSRPERYLWNGGCRVTAVSFPKLGRGGQRSIRCFTRRVDHG